MEVLIREMELSDVLTVVENDTLIFGQTLGETTFRDDLINNDFTYYFIMESKIDHRFIGHLGLWIDVPFAQILNFYIVPSTRKLGLGSLFLQYAITYLASKNVNTLTLEVRKSNQEALRLYEKFEFTIAATRAQYYSNGEDSFLMIKNI
jgi:ribosomal-protein-alanine N-acetyltransferase